MAFNILDGPRSRSHTSACSDVQVVLPLRYKTPRSIEKLTFRPVFALGGLNALIFGLREGRLGYFQSRQAKMSVTHFITSGTWHFSVLPSKVFCARAEAEKRSGRLFS